MCVCIRIHIYTFFQILFHYRYSFFRLHWVFITVCRLSVVAASRGYSLVVVCRLLILGASLVAEHGVNSHGRIHTQWLSGLSSRSLWAQLPHSTWNLPRPGIEPVSLASAGGFLTTGPPGKPPIVDILTSRCLLGTSLAVQWLRFHAYTAEGTGSAPDQGSSTHYTVKPKNFLKDAFSSPVPKSLLVMRS